MRNSSRFPLVDGDPLRSARVSLNFFYVRLLLIQLPAIPHSRNPSIPFGVSMACPLHSPLQAMSPVLFLTRHWLAAAWGLVAGITQPQTQERRKTMTDTINRDESSGPKPTYVIKTREKKDGKYVYEKIGVGFLNDNGSIYISMIGTQSVSDCMLYEIVEPETVAE
jgi:hypothetical protein